MDTLRIVDRVLRLRLWPWWGAGITGVCVAAVIVLARGEFHGISAFSSTNFGWLAFALVGGVVYAWRLADGNPLPWGLLRPLAAGAVTFALCATAVCAMGLLFLPEQPLPTTLGTDAMGRAWVVALPVVAAGYLAEAVRWLWRSARRTG